MGRKLPFGGKAAKQERMKNSRVYETKPSLTGIIRKQLARVKAHHIRKNVFAHLIENSLICASGSQKRLRKVRPLSLLWSRVFRKQSSYL